MDQVECIIAGGGVIGLAIGRAFAMAGREVLVIERNSDFGLETSGRNSEVIHAGIYYPPASLKARLCVAGRARLIEYLKDRAIAHRLCGKLIVAASPEQAGKLAEIEARAIANGVTSLERLDKPALRLREPDLVGHSALLSPDTGIFDSRAYMISLLGDIEASGGLVSVRTTITAISQHGDGHVVNTIDPDGNGLAIGCRVFVNATGLRASELARTIHGSDGWQVPETRYARGTYFTASGATPFSHLVYPVPEPGGLGIHLTLDLDGRMRFGPDVEWIDTVNYELGDHRRAHFSAAISRYWPDIGTRELNPSYCGIRPKLAGPGEPDADFMIAGPETHGVNGLVHLFGIESPGLTASLAIAEHVAGLV